MTSRLISLSISSAVFSLMFCVRLTLWPRNTSSWFSEYMSGPNASDMPQRVTMSRARPVAIWISLDAPLDTLS